jgi:hypothetical protein
MANGDAAAAAGLQTFAPTQDIRLGYDNDNIRGDELAAHLISGTHPASAITSGVLDIARIPAITADRVPALDSSKITTGTFGTDRISGYGTGTWSGLVSGQVSNTVPNQMGTLGLTGGLSAGGGISSTGGGISASGDISAGSNVYGGNTYNQTNVPARAMYVGTNGLFGIGSSSRKFKKDIKDAELNVDAILQIAVRHFVYKKTFSEDQSIQIGVIAEELHDLGLHDFVIYDNDEPIAVHYDKLALAALIAIQAQSARLDTLEARLEALEK